MAHLHTNRSHKSTTGSKKQPDFKNPLSKYTFDHEENENVIPLDEDDPGKVNTPEVTKSPNLRDMVAKANYQEKEKKSFNPLGRLHNLVQSAIFGTPPEVDLIEEDLAHDWDMRKKWYGLLHPETGVRAIYDLFQVVVLLFLLFAIPFRIGFAINNNKYWSLFILDAFLNLTIVVDIYLNHYQFYYDEITKILVTDKELIRKKYRKSWFIIDLIAVFPFDFVLMLMNALLRNDLDDIESVAGSIRLIRLVRLLRLAKLFNMQLITRSLFKILSTIIPTITELQIEFQFRIFFLVFIMISTSHFLGCFFAMIGRENIVTDDPHCKLKCAEFDSEFDSENECLKVQGRGMGWIYNWFGVECYSDLPDRWDQYIIVFYYTMVTMSTVGYGDVLPDGAMIFREKSFAVLLIIVGAFLYAYIIGEFSSIISNIRQDKVAYDSKMRAVGELMIHLQVPPEINRKVHDYYAFKFSNKTLFDDHQIYDDLPHGLKTALVLHRFKKVINKVPFFFNLRDDIVVRICQRLQDANFMPDEVITEKGDHHDELFILSRGVACLLDPEDGHIIEDIPAGSFWGEREFLGLDEVRGSTTKARTYCETSTLKQSDIADIMDESKVLKDRLMKYIELRSQMAGTDNAEKNIFEQMKHASEEEAENEKKEEVNFGNDEFVHDHGFNHGDHHGLTAYEKTQVHKIGSLEKKLDLILRHMSIGEDDDIAI